jgi:hypothetical protein
MEPERGLFALGLWLLIAARLLMRARAFLFLFGSVGVALSAACAASLDLDRFTKAEAALLPDASDDRPGPATVTYLDLSFSAKQMNSHFDEALELRIVDKNNAVQAKLVSENIQYPRGVVGLSLDFTFFMKGVIPKSNPPYRIDFWADHNKNGTYDGNPQAAIDEKDHGWRRVLREPFPDEIRLVGTTYEFNFVHDTNFSDIFTDLDGNKISGADELLDFSVTVVNTAAHRGKMLEMRVVDKATGRLIGLHRRGSVPETYEAKISGIIDEVTPYEIRAYVDDNQDERYETGEPSWKIEVTSGADGIRRTLDLDAEPKSPLDPADTPCVRLKPDDCPGQ